MYYCLAKAFLDSSGRSYKAGIFSSSIILLTKQLHDEKFGTRARQEMGTGAAHKSRNDCDSVGS